MSSNRRDERCGLLVFLAVAFLLCPVHCGAQDVRELGHFDAMGGTVQLLPTGTVLKQEEGKTTVYSYQKGHYIASKGLQESTVLAAWTYFDWHSVDWGDQIDRNASDIPDGAYWPRNAKVKKLVYLSPQNAPEVSVLVCYTVPEPPVKYPLATSKRIRLVALKGAMTDRGYVYRELWTKTLQKESSYGELVVQQVPGVGSVLVFYSASAGVSSETRQLNLYLLQNMN